MYKVTQIVFKWKEKYIYIYVYKYKFINEIK